MPEKCLVTDCTEAPSQSAGGWLYLTVLDSTALREGALCRTHAYCLAAFLDGRDPLVPRSLVSDIGGDDGARELSRRRTVLVVDDDAGIRDGVSELLIDEGFDVLCAADGEAAMAALRTDRSIQLILLDLTMPHMDGWAFRAAQVANPELATIPVIVMSALPGAADRSASLFPGSVLMKPLDADMLVARVNLLC
jgi:CheY-like chemotaxis protein